MPRAIQLALAAIVSLSPVAALADATAEQAQALQQQVRRWVESSFGLTAAFLNDLSFAVVPERDHYRFSLRLGAIPLLSGMQNDEMSVAAQALPAGQWLVFDQRLASPMHLRTTLPNSGAAGGPNLSGPLEMLFRFGKVSWGGLIDPGFATPSILSTTMEGYDVDAKAGDFRQVMGIGKLAGQVSLLPIGGARIDIRDDAAADDFSIAVKGQGPEQSFAAFLGRVEASGKIAGLLPDGVGALVRAFTEPATMAAMSAPDSNPSALLRLLYSKLRGIATGAEFREALEDLRGEMGGHRVGIGRLMLGWGVDGSGGMLSGHVEYAVDGIAAPDIPPEIRPYVPSHVLVRQSVSGIDLADLDALILAAIEQGPAVKLEQPEIAPRVQAMFAHGGIVNALDALEVDIGGTRFAATGRITAVSLDHFKGQASVSATGFDALVARVRTSAEWGKVAPFLQLLGMIGRQDGERIVWTITSDNADVSVNGLDIPALIAAGEKLEKH